jgi:hypothetical protein
MKIGTFLLLIFVPIVLYRFIVWLMGAKRTPDPWGPEVEQELNSPESLPVCPHCLTPQEHNGWFCPQCGSTVGQYGNYLPFVYTFTIGDALRSGAGRAKSSFLLTLGYVLVGLSMLNYLVIMVPICLFFLIKGMIRPNGKATPAA